jgi:ferredoxin
MAEAEIKFDEGREGIVPIGTYLIDAARRMGAGDFDCVETGEHCCQIMVTAGGEHLSAITKSESDLLTDEERKNGVRLACFAKIEKPGVITAMVKKKKEESSAEEKAEERTEEYKKEFTEMPLERKIAKLMELEAIALGETFAFVVNSPFKVFEKIGDVMAEFGFKKEEDQKRRSRPVEQSDEPKENKDKKNASSHKGSEPQTNV